VWFNLFIYFVKFEVQFTLYSTVRLSTLRVWVHEFIIVLHCIRHAYLIYRHREVFFLMSSNNMISYMSLKFLWNITGLRLTHIFGDFWQMIRVLLLYWKENYYFSGILYELSILLLSYYLCFFKLYYYEMLLVIRFGLWPLSQLVTTFNLRLGLLFIKYMG